MFSAAMQERQMKPSKDRQAEAPLREATGGDLVAINDIYNHYVRVCTCTYQVEPDSMADREAWFKEHGPRHPVIVAESAGEVVAWGSLSAWGSRRAREAYSLTVEDSVYVRHDMHGRGIGAAILTELMRRAKALGYHSVLASISADREVSLRLHEKFGFSKVAHLHEVGMKFEKWLDVVYLQKRL
jgi:L-amino acid N-acyltransferase